ncbi:MAG: hypothetical protein MJB14_21915 [Spirochaetes bacterium]|nr:hypothetical protein [Spirochaetota bacterium]
MKEKLFHFFKYSIFAVALLQLALSQIHISVITKVFATHIGFYLFLFILFGLVLAFNVVTLKRKSNMLPAVLFSIAALVSGYIYLKILYTSIGTSKVLVFDDVLVLVLFSVLSLLVYVVHSLGLLFCKEESKNKHDVAVK